MRLLFAIFLCLTVTLVRADRNASDLRKTWILSGDMTIETLRRQVLNGQVDKKALSHLRILIKAFKDQMNGSIYFVDRPLLTGPKFEEQDSFFHFYEITPEKEFKQVFVFGQKTFLGFDERGRTPRIIEFSMSGFRKFKTQSELLEDSQYAQLEFNDEDKGKVGTHLLTEMELTDALQELNKGRAANCSTQFL